MCNNPIELAEKSIDKAFNNSPLLELNYAQAIWTLLSVIEDHNLKIQHINRLPDEHLLIYIDILINAFAHPIRAIYLAGKDVSKPIVKKLIDEHYNWADEWIRNAIIYDAFCTIFPLWHRGKIELTINNNILNTGCWRNKKLEYEAYNRIIEKDGKTKEKHFDSNKITQEIMANVKFDGTTFDLNLNPKLAKKLIDNYAEFTNARYELPDYWKTSKFSFGEFRYVFTAIQALLYARFVVRAILSSNGMKGLGYSSAVWLVSLNELSSRLARYTAIPIGSVGNILQYLTFGSNGIKVPDIAIQPLIDLKNGLLALSPFVWTNSNAERNFCVLLNQIPIEQTLYSRLTQEKENLLRREIDQFISDFGYETRSGSLDNTNLDVAVIDRIHKVCICFELKWFIEPAEIREIVQKTLELEKGVAQAKFILELFKHNDDKLVNQILKIDSSYEFLVCVGSRNWIGDYDVQDDDVPIIKVWHFLEKLKELGSLSKVLKWLKLRKYLPREGTDYEVNSSEFKMGDICSSWYGIKPIAKK